MAVFSLGRIAVTAIACALVAGLVLAWRHRHLAVRSRVPAGAIVLLVGVLVLAWRLLDNAWRLNDDFLPGISIADLGGGVVAGLTLLTLTPLHPGICRDSGGGGRDWLATSGLVALAVFITNVVFI
jgi:hypothetical protein